MDKQKILIIDDDPELVKAIRIRLEEAGYVALAAYDGQEGLNSAYKEKPDLVILDLMMPKMDGYEVCLMLKTDKRYSDIPIIMLTAKSRPEDIRIGKAMAADAYITKPFQHEAVLAKVKELLKEEG